MLFITVSINSTNAAYLAINGISSYVPTILSINSNKPASDYISIYFNGTIFYNSYANYESGYYLLYSYNSS